MALYAFNLEVARTAEIVSEHLLGEIRLQWWREAVDGLFAGKPRRHYVLDLLAGPVAEGLLQRHRFDRIIDTRAFDLDPRPPANLAALESYLEGTSSSLIALALDILGERAANREQLATSCGLAYGLIGIIRAVPFHGRQGRHYLPADMAAEAGLAQSEQSLLRSTVPLRDVARILANRAREHLRQAESLAGSVGKQSLAAILPLTLARGYLRRLVAAGYDPFDESVQRRLPGAAWALAWARLRMKA